MGRKKLKNPRRNQVHVYLSDSEKGLIERVASMRGVRASTLIYNEIKRLFEGFKREIKIAQRVLKFERLNTPWAWSLINVKF